MVKKTTHLYFDSASTTIMPKELLQKYMLNLEGYENYRRQDDKIGDKITRSREIVAKYISGNSKNIAFTGKSTYISNLIAYSLIFNSKKKLKVITTAFDHHSTSAPWYEQNENGRITISYLENEICRNQDIFIEKIFEFSPDILLLTTVNNVTGEVLNVPEIVRKVKAKNSSIIIICDAAQSCLNPNLNGSLEQIDFMYFSTHKMFGPKDLGILHLNDKQMKNFKPLFIGGGGIYKIESNHVFRKDIISQIESGTINSGSITTLENVINFINENYDHQHIIKLQNQLIKELKKIDSVEIYSHKSNNQIAFNLSGVHNHDLVAYLRSKQIIARGGNLCNSKLMNDLKINGCVRISFNILNTLEEVEKLAMEINQFHLLWDEKMNI
jgi:selenocysteine lyase/cysteine desulfurase